MHTYAPPIAALNAWLNQTRVDLSAFGHLLLEQAGPSDQALISALKPYFESAHLDARTAFHDDAGLDLHPDADAVGSNAQYPACLPEKAVRGLFGEALCGLVVEAYPLVGNHSWKVPVFLFRHHADAQKYIYTLARDPKRQREVMGRHGNDFIAIRVDPEGNVTSFLAGEAKWRKTLTPSVISTLMEGDLVPGPAGAKVRSGKGVWYEVNRELNAPDGLRQLQGILKAYDLPEHAQTILSIEKVVSLKIPQILPRTDLVLVCGNASTTRKPGTALLPNAGTPAEYTAGRDLQIVEVVLTKGEGMVSQLYNSLWVPAP